MEKDLHHSKVLIRAADLKEMGYTRFQIPSLLRRGKIIRMSRGLYCWTDASLSSHSTIASIGKLVPNGIICLLTALRYHDIGTQNPISIWVAVPSSYRSPNISDISVITVHFNYHYQKTGVELVNIDGVSVKITNPVRTIVDCFRFRNKIGLDVAIEALEDGVRKKIFTADELVKMARTCRIYTVMKPYIETIFR